MTSRKAKITKRVVDALEPGTLVWDTELAGFGVRQQKRNRVYVLKTRVGARQRWFTIGKHGSPWTPEKARREALAILGEIERGQDPATERDAESKMPTLARIAERFLLEEVVPKRAPATATLYGDLWERLAKPDLGNLKVGDVCFRDVADLHYKLRGTRIPTARVGKVAKLFKSIISTRRPPNAGRIADAAPPTSRATAGRIDPARDGLSRATFSA